MRRRNVVSALGNVQLGNGKLILCRKPIGPWLLWLNFLWALCCLVEKKKGGCITLGLVKKMDIKKLENKDISGIDLHQASHR